MTPVEDELIKKLEQNRIKTSPETKFHDPSGEINRRIEAANEMLDDCIETIKQYFSNKFAIRMRRTDRIDVVLHPELFDNFLNCCNQIPEVQKQMEVDTITIDPIDNGSEIVISRDSDKQLAKDENKDVIMFLYSGICFEREGPCEAIITKDNIINLSDYSSEVYKNSVMKDIDAEIDKMMNSDLSNDKNKE